MSPLCRILVVAVLVIATSACSTDDNASGSGSATSNLDSALMAKGTDLMYQKGDPIAAEQVFRQVLEHSPNHYGAHYQLAVAVDRAGRPAEARLMWQDVLKRAQAVNDSETIRAAVPRLAAPDTVGSNQRMIIALDLLYAKNNPGAAADEFKKVLALKPQHYGATYQLAKSLDLAGKHEEAKPIWSRMVTMAEAVNDKTTADTARARLKQSP